MNNINRQIGHKVLNKVRNHVWKQGGQQVLTQVRQQVWGQVWNHVLNQVQVNMPLTPTNFEAAYQQVSKL